MEELMTKQKQKLDELAKATNFFKTQELLNKYGKSLTPAKTPARPQIPQTPKTPMGAPRPPIAPNITPAHVAQLERENQVKIFFLKKLRISQDVERTIIQVNCFNAKTCNAISKK